MEEEAKINAQAQDAFAIIGDLDSALKAFQGALGLSDVRPSKRWMFLAKNINKYMDII